MARPSLRFLCALALTSITFVAQADELTVGYQTGIDPSKVPQADGAYEQAIGETIAWRRFNSGPEVVTAIASGDVQIGNLGSSPLAAAASRKLPIVAFIVSAQINEVWVARKDFAEKHPEVVSKFAKVTLDAFADYAANKAQWTTDSVPVQKIAKLTGANPADVPQLLAGAAFPEAQAQPQLLQSQTPKAIGETAQFLKEQGKVDAVLADYAPYVSAKFIQ